jgi:hypothetical protein
MELYTYHVLFQTCSFVADFDQSPFIMDGSSLLAGLGESQVKLLHGISLCFQSEQNYGVMITASIGNFINYSSNRNKTIS